MHRSPVSLSRTEPARSPMSSPAWALRASCTGALNTDANISLPIATICSGMSKVRESKRRKCGSSVQVVDHDLLGPS